MDIIGVLSRSKSPQLPVLVKIRPKMWIFFSFCFCGCRNYLSSLTHFLADLFHRRSCAVFLGVLPPMKFWIESVKSFKSYSVKKKLHKILHKIPTPLNTILSEKLSASKNLLPIYWWVKLPQNHSVKNVLKNH